jgi:chromosome segregation ATPase
MTSGRALRSLRFGWSIGLPSLPVQRRNCPSILLDLANPRAARSRASRWVSALAVLLLSATLAAPAARGQPASPNPTTLPQVQEKLAGLRGLQSSAAARIACLRLVAESLQVESVAGQEKLAPLKQRQAELASQAIRLQEAIRLAADAVKNDEKQVAVARDRRQAAWNTFQSRNNGWFHFWRPGTWRATAQEVQNADQAFGLSQKRLRESNEGLSRAAAELESLQPATAENRVAVDSATSEIAQAKAALRDLHGLFQKLRISLDTLNMSIAAADEVNVTELSVTEQLTRHAAEVDTAARELSQGLERAAAALPADRVNKDCPATR